MILYSPITLTWSPHRRHHHRAPTTTNQGQSALSRSGEETQWEQGKISGFVKEERDDWETERVERKLLPPIYRLIKGRVRLLGERIFHYFFVSFSLHQKSASHLSSLANCNPQRLIENVLKTREGDVVTSSNNCGLKISSSQFHHWMRYKYRRIIIMQLQSATHGRYQEEEGQDNWTGFN